MSYIVQMSACFHYMISMSHNPQTYKNRLHLNYILFTKKIYVKEQSSCDWYQLTIMQVVSIKYCYFPLACINIIFWQLNSEFHYSLLVSWVKCINRKIIQQQQQQQQDKKKITILVQKTSPSLRFCAACIASVMIHEGFRSGYKRERTHLEKSSTAPVYYSIPKISLSVTLKISSEGKKWSEGSCK